MVIDRCPTGIVGFDKLCQGGYVRNSDNLLIGGPGSGKTTFMLQFLWNGATRFNENGLYCSFEPDILEILKDGLNFGWDFSKLNEQDKVKFLKFAPQTSIEELKSELTRLISKYSIKRVCFDPISVLALNLDKPGEVRQEIFDLSNLMKRLNVTSIIADEGVNLQTEENLSKTDILKFLSDSVTLLHESGISGVSDRALSIMKMRRTQHTRAPVAMAITDNGVEIAG